MSERCDEIRVTAVQTGTANLQRLGEMGTPGRSPTERKLDILRDHDWAGPLPIYAYLVEHPQGVFVVDTGDRARNSDRDYPPKLNPFFQRKVKITVAPEEEIGPRLAALGVDPERDVRALVMTHLHHDHTGGLYHFPHTPVIASASACAPPGDSVA